MIAFHNCARTSQLASDWNWLDPAWRTWDTYWWCPAAAHSVWSPPWWHPAPPHRCHCCHHHECYCPQFSRPRVEPSWELSEWANCRPMRGLGLWCSANQSAAPSLTSLTISWLTPARPQILTRAVTALRTSSLRKSQFMFSTVHKGSLLFIDTFMKMTQDLWW